MSTRSPLHLSWILIAMFGCEPFVAVGGTPKGDSSELPERCVDARTDAACVALDEVLREDPTGEGCAWVEIRAIETEDEVCGEIASDPPRTECIPVRYRGESCSSLCGGEHGTAYVRPYSGPDELVRVDGEGNETPLVSLEAIAEPAFCEYQPIGFDACGPDDPRPACGCACDLYSDVPEVPGPPPTDDVCPPWAYLGVVVGAELPSTAPLVGRLPCTVTGLDPTESAWSIGLACEAEDASSLEFVLRIGPSDLVPPLELEQSVVLRYEAVDDWEGQTWFSIRTADDLALLLAGGDASSLAPRDASSREMFDPFSLSAEAGGCARVSDPCYEIEPLRLQTGFGAQYPGQLAVYEVEGRAYRVLLGQAAVFHEVTCEDVFSPSFSFVIAATEP